MAKGTAAIVDTGNRPWEELPKQHRDFVARYVAHGDAVKAALEVGYKDNSYLTERARNLRNILSNHIDQYTKKYIRSADMTILGTHVIKALAQSADSETVRLNAAKELLVRSSPEVKESKVTHDVNYNNLPDSALDKRIAEIQEKLQKLGGNVIDVSPG